MAAIWFFYGGVLVVRLGPPVFRYVQGTSGPAAPAHLEHWLHRAGLLDESDEELSVAFSDDVGHSVVVATFSEPFEVRRVQMSWNIGSGTLLDEDVRVCTFHLLKAPSGTPTPTWDAGDFTTAKNAFYAFWESLKQAYRTEITLSSLKFYREGPAILPPQPPVFSEEPTPIPGALTTKPLMPPQVAVSITERTAVRRSWGRVYLPAPCDGYNDGAILPTLDNVGRLTDEFCSWVADKADTLYETLRTASLLPVVYRKPLPARFSADAIRDGDEEPDLPARAGSCLTVDTLQVDNIYDVIRSRRFDRPTLRVQRGVGP